MTTSVVITPAGHHVRVTPIYPDGPPPGQGDPIELAPGDAPRTIYIHNGLSLKVEEYDPNAEPAQPDGVTDADAEARETA